MEKEFQIVETGPLANIHIDSLSATLKTYQTIKSLDLLEYMVSNFKSSLKSMPDWLSKIKQTYSNGWPQKSQPWSRKTAQMKSSQTVIDL